MGAVADARSATPGGDTDDQFRSTATAAQLSPQQATVSIRASVDTPPGGVGSACYVAGPRVHRRYLCPTVARARRGIASLRR